MTTFEPFEKIARLKRGCVITEKIDGTNAQVFITREPTELTNVVAEVDGAFLYAGSRSRWLLPDKTADNFGFAKWVQDNADALAMLGEGRHYGEWWGAGIQRRYGQDRKRFSLFNASRWAHERPACCDVVPVLYSGDFTTTAVDEALAALAQGGSRAAPGFMDPEGVIVYHAAARALFKVTIKGDEQPKGAAA